MRSKLLVFSLFFSRTNAGDGLGQISYTYSEKSKKEMDERLARYNATFPPIIPSYGLLEKDSISRQSQLNGTTRDFLIALENPETLARHVVSAQRAACDRTKSFAGLSVIVNTAIEMTNQNTVFAGGYVFAPKRVDTILLTEPSTIGNPTQVNTIVHEGDHRFWHAHNIARCNAKETKQAGKQQVDTKLTRNEKLSAPYNSRNKKDFIAAINEAKQNLAQLREDANALQAIPAGTLPDPDLKSRLDCYEEEAKQFAVINNLPNTRSALALLLNKLMGDLDMTKAVYAESEVYYELNAVINAQLSFYPKIFNDHCRKLRTWYVNTAPKFAEIVEELDQGRFALTCKRR